MECPRCHNQIGSHSKHCKRCGEAIPSSQYLLEECGLAETETVSARLPASAGAASARSNRRYRFARLGDRFIAFALDLALLVGIFAIVDAWALMRWGRFEASEFQVTRAALVIAVMLN